MFVFLIVRKIVYLCECKCVSERIIGFVFVLVARGVYVSSSDRVRVCLPVCVCVCVCVRERERVCEGIVCIFVCIFLWYCEILW